MGKEQPDSSDWTGKTNRKRKRWRADKKIKSCFKVLICIFNAICISSALYLYLLKKRSADLDIVSGIVWNCSLFTGYLWADHYEHAHLLGTYLIALISLGSVVLCVTCSEKMQNTKRVSY